VAAGSSGIIIDDLEWP